MKTVSRALLASLAFGCAVEAHAQGCAMCLASAMSQGPGAMEAMNLGILVLLVPPFLMIVGIIGFTFLRRSQ